MKRRSVFFYISVIVSTGCLSVGYFLAGYWQILIILFGILLFGLVAKRQPVTWLASGFLLVYIVLAAIGVVADMSVVLMITACTFALASWELSQFEGSEAGNSVFQTDTPLEKYHLRSLAVATVTGLLLAILSSYIHLKLPFGVIVSLVLITLGGLTYSVQHFRKKER